MAKNTVEQSAPRIGRASNVEDERFKRETRSALNATYSTVATLQTLNTSTLTDLWVDPDPVSFNSDVMVQIKVKGTGVTSPSTNYAYYEKVAYFSRASTGLPTQNGTTTDKVAPLESNAAFDCTLGLTSDGNVRVRVNDGGNGSTDWKAWIEVRRDQ